jgi:hypothetical protein
MSASSSLPHARNDSSLTCVLWVSIALEGTQRWGSEMIRGQPALVLVFSRVYSQE